MKVNLPKKGTGKSRLALVGLGIAVFVLGCLGAWLLDVLAGLLFGW